MRPEGLIVVTGFTARVELNDMARLPIRLFLSVTSVLIRPSGERLPVPTGARPEATSTLKAYNGLTEKQANQAAFDILFTFYATSQRAGRKRTCTQYLAFTAFATESREDF
jgi:hypothetical protein